jgi:hypothetical protein
MSLNATQIKILAKEIVNCLASNENKRIADRMQALKKSKEYADLNKLHDKLIAATQTYKEAEAVFEHKHAVACIKNGKELLHISNANSRKFSGYNAGAVHEQIIHKLHVQMMRKQDVDVDALINDIIEEYEQN